MVSETFRFATAPPCNVNLKVTVFEAEAVLPTEPKELGQIYSLNNLDQIVPHMMVKTIYLYHANEGVTDDPVKAIKDSLAKVLNIYYPLAGRLETGKTGKLQVNYNAQGVPFAEGYADAYLADLGNVNNLDKQLHQLVYTAPEPPIFGFFETPLAAQVTKFNCGGFVLGLAVHHAMFDGVSATNFINLWSEFARGLKPHSLPCIDRSNVIKARNPLQIDFKFAHDLDILSFEKYKEIPIEKFVPKDDPVERTFILSADTINNLKKSVIEKGGLKRCTTFEVLSALVWKARSVSIKMEQGMTARLYIVTDGRPKVYPSVPADYTGNVLMIPYAASTSDDLKSTPLHETVKLVGEAISIVDEKYVMSRVDYLESIRVSPGISNPGAMVVSSWMGLPFSNTDFGWGNPWQTAPVTIPVPQLVLFTCDGRQSRDRRDAHIMVCLPRKDMDVFAEVLNDLLK